MGTFHTYTCNVFLKRTDSATQGKQGPGAHGVIKRQIFIITSALNV